MGDIFTIAIKDMTPKLITKRFFLCPNCGKHHFQYEHLCGLKKCSNYGWTCTVCYASVAFTIDETDQINIDKVVVPKFPKGLVLLQLLPNKVNALSKPLYLIVEHPNYFHKENLNDFSKELEYYFNEHTCPSNYLGGNKLLYEGDDDPHGLFQFVEVIWKPEGFSSMDFHNEGGDYSTLFKSLRITNDPESTAVH